MRRRELTQADLAKLTGLNQGNLSSVILGGRLSLEGYRRIAKALKVPIRTLLPARG